MRVTHALVQVAAALMNDASGQHWGYELSKSSGVRSGVMYPVLQRMLEQGWLTDGWEIQARAGKSSRPPRRYYKLTDEGRGGSRRVAHRSSSRYQVRPRPCPSSRSGLDLMASYVIAWPTLGIAILVFGFAPGVILRRSLIYPRAIPSCRQELIGELYAVPRIERPFWVAEQFEIAIFEGVRERFTARRLRKTSDAAWLDNEVIHLQVNIRKPRPTLRRPVPFVPAKRGSTPDR